MITALRRQKQRTTGAGEKHEQNKEAAEFQETKFFKVRKRKRKKKTGLLLEEKGRWRELNSTHRNKERESLVLSPEQTNTHK